MSRAQAEVERHREHDALVASSVHTESARASVQDVGAQPEVAPRIRRGRTMPRPRTPLSIESASAGMITRRVVVPVREVVFVKGVLEASEGVAAVFAESGGELAIVTHASREPALREILADLAEIGLAEIGLAEVGLAEEPLAPRALSGA